VNSQSRKSALRMPFDHLPSLISTARGARFKLEKPPRDAAARHLARAATDVVPVAAFGGEGTPVLKVTMI
jgi:hypothetical protein